VVGERENLGRAVQSIRKCCELEPHSRATKKSHEATRYPGDVNILASRVMELIEAPYNYLLLLNRLWWP